MDAREERLAKNESVFRDLNEKVAQVAGGHGADRHVYEFLCECSNLDCTLRVALTLQVYEQARTEPTVFIVAPGHELPEIEVVVFRGEGYQLVRKHGEAADLVTERDPRSDE